MQLILLFVRCVQSVPLCQQAILTMWQMI